MWNRMVQSCSLLHVDWCVSLLSYREAYSLTSSHCTIWYMYFNPCHLSVGCCSQTDRHFLYSSIIALCSVLQLTPCHCCHADKHTVSYVVIVPFGTCISIHLTLVWVVAVKWTDTLKWAHSHTLQPLAPCSILQFGPCQWARGCCWSTAHAGQPASECTSTYCGSLRSNWQTCCSGTFFHCWATCTIFPQSISPKPNLWLTWWPPPLMVQLESALGILVPWTTTCWMSRHVREGLKMPKWVHGERMYLCWSLCTLYLYACFARVTLGNCGLGLCCICVPYFAH